MMDDLCEFIHSYEFIEIDKIVVNSSWLQHIVQHNVVNWLKSREYMNFLCHYGVW